MKKNIVINIVYAVLMFGVSICMLMQAINGGGLIYFGIGSGIGIAPKDLGMTLLFLALLTFPFWIALQIDAKRKTRFFRFAPVASLLMLLLFPISIEGRLWSNASFPDGKPMFDESFNTRVKSWDAFWGYVPLWKADFDVEPPYDRYETTALSTREMYVGNSVWGKSFLYGLNKKGWLAGEDTEPDKVYECVFEETTHFLGFYWRDRRGTEMMYWPESKLPRDKCQRIAKPDIGSQIR